MADQPESYRLPEQINPRKWADSGRDIKAQVELQGFDRLQELIESSGSLLDLDIRFSRDPDRKYRIEGHVGCSVELVCQRCLEKFDFKLNAMIDLIIVFTEDQARALPKEQDAWIVEEDDASLLEMLEDELILGLPVIAIHPESECSGTTEFDSGDEEPVASEKPNPFAILESLKGPKNLN